MESGLVAVVLISTVLAVIFGFYLRKCMDYIGKILTPDSVRDEKNEYVARGIQRDTNVTLFRGVRFPNLAPTYATNLATVPNLRPHAGDMELLHFDFPDFEQCNTGWAMLAAAVENGTRSVKPSGGSVEMVNSLEAGVVSKYWILILGLVGRYGSLPAMTNGTISDMDWHQSERSAQRQQGQDSAPYHLFQGRFGTWDLTNEPAAILSGFTGRFRSLGRQKSEKTLQSAVAFDGRSAKEAISMLGPMAAETLSKDSIEEAEPLSVHFWLANGFVLSWSDDPDSTPPALSLLDPVPSGLQDLLTDTGRSNRIHEYFRLQKADVNKEIRKGAQSMNVSKWTTELWTASPEEQPKEEQWCTIWPDGPEGPSKAVHMWRDDVDRTSQQFLSIRWPLFGYVAWKHNCSCWERLMIDASEMLRPTFASLSRHNLYRDQLQEELQRLATNDQQRTALRVLWDWKPGVHHLHKTAEYVLAADTLKELMGRECRSNRALLGGLLITSKALRIAVYTVLDQRTFPPAAVNATVSWLEGARSAAKQAAEALRDVRQFKDKAEESEELARAEAEAANAAVNMEEWDDDRDDDRDYDMYVAAAQESARSARSATAHCEAAEVEAKNAMIIFVPVEMETAAAQAAYEQTKIHARAVAARGPTGMETIEAAAEQVSKAAREVAERAEVPIAGKEAAAITARTAFEEAAAASKAAKNVESIAQFSVEAEAEDDKSPKADVKNGSAKGELQKIGSSQETDDKNEYIREQIKDREDRTERRAICNHFRLSAAKNRLSIEWDTQQSKTVTIDGITFRQNDDPLHTERQTAYWPGKDFKPEDISEDDLLLTAAWTAVRCELWLSARDSQPLMEFVRSLDENVFVM